MIGRLLGVVVALFLLTTTAHADKARARELYDKGTKAYNLQDYTRALDLFKQAYEQQSDSVLLFNIAQCQRQLGQYEAASKSYRVYLNETPSAPNKSEVKTQIKAMDEAAREQRANQPPMGTQPPTGEAAVEKKEEPVPAAALPPTTPPPPDSPRRPWYKNGAAMGLTFGGVAVLAAGAGLAAFGSARRHDIDELPSLPERNAAADDAAVFRPTGFALIGVGFAAVVTGVVLFVVEAKKKSPARHAWNIEPTANGLSASW